jgi:hypothetical protein
LRYNVATTRIKEVNGKTTINLWKRQRMALKSSQIRVTRMKVLHVKVELTKNTKKVFGKIERSAEAFRERHTPISFPPTNPQPQYGLGNQIGKKLGTMAIINLYLMEEPLCVVL